MNREQKIELANREWHLDALITWGNMESIKQHISTTDAPQLRWAWEQMSLQFEDELGMADFIISENKNVAEVMKECQFAKGKELTGKLQDWIMNLDNQYEA